MFTIYLPDYVIKMLSVLLSRNLDSKERMSILENGFHIAMTEKVKQEVATMCNLSKGVREDGRKEGHADTALEMLKDKQPLRYILKYSKLDEKTVYDLAKENGLEVIVA